ncbi:MAG: hypothetical protein H7321_10530 [Bacteroidia bacterium]|nr:hypothetical protein [Bacteroidia bacterium]
MAKKHKNQFFLQIDRRRTAFNDQKVPQFNIPILMNGLATGIIRDRFKMGVGFYFVRVNALKAEFITDVNYINNVKADYPDAHLITNPNNEPAYLVLPRLRLFYFTPSFEYTFYKSKYINLNIPIEVGMGFSKTTATDYLTDVSVPVYGSNGNVLRNRAYFFPALTGMSAILKISPDVGLKIAGGYRKILKQVGLSPNFDGFYYQVTLQLTPGNLKRKLAKDYLKYKKKKDAKEAKKKK